MAFDFGSLTGVGYSAIRIASYIVGAIVLGGVSFLLAKVFGIRLKYNQAVTIWEVNDSGRVIAQKKDIAGIFIDNKTNNKLFFLKKHKVGLNPDRVPYVFDGKKRMVHVAQVALKNFRYIIPSIQMNPGTTLNLLVSEEDVNWALNAYDRHKVMWQNNIWMQILPFMTIAFVSLMILVIFIYFFKEFSTLKDMATAFQAAAEALARGNLGTTVIQ